MDATKVSLHVRISSHKLIRMAGDRYRPWIRESVGALGGGQGGKSIHPPSKCGMPNPSYDIVLLQKLNRVDQAVDAWTRALGALPAGSLTPAEQKQRDQYSSEVAAAKAEFEHSKANPKEPEGMTTFGPSEREKLPWKRAAAMIPGLIASQTWNSSVRRSCVCPPLDVILMLFSCVGMGN